MIDIRENVPLASMTTFRIGGNARYYVEVLDIEQLKEALEFAKEKDLDFFVLGGGSNVLVSDSGYDGLIIKLKFGEIKIEENIIEAGSGTPLIKLVNFAASNGLSGIESLAGIPGTVGGAIRGNAGAFGTMIGDAIENVVVLDSENGELQQLKKEDCLFAYRESIFKKEKNLIVISGKFKLSKGDIEMVQSETKEIIAKRVANELGGEKSAGSFFANPIVSDRELVEKFEKEKGVKQKDDKLPAGWIIDQVGLRGKKIGGAMVSDKHANYIINTGDAKAEDVVMLASYVKQQVRDQLGVQLVEEISYLGF